MTSTKRVDQWSMTNPKFGKEDPVKFVFRVHLNRLERIKKSILFNSDFSIGQDCAQCKSQVDDHYKEEWSVEKSPTRQFEEGRRAN